jgi:hypothetical protein
MDYPLLNKTPPPFSPSSKITAERALRAEMKCKRFLYCLILSAFYILMFFNLIAIGKIVPSFTVVVVPAGTYWCKAEFWGKIFKGRLITGGTPEFW